MHWDWQFVSMHGQYLYNNHSSKRWYQLLVTINRSPIFEKCIFSYLEKIM